MLVVVEVVIMGLPMEMVGEMEISKALALVLTLALILAEWVAWLGCRHSGISACKRQLLGLTSGHQNVACYASPWAYLSVALHSGAMLGPQVIQVEPLALFHGPAG